MTTTTPVAEGVEEEQLPPNFFLWTVQLPRWPVLKRPGIFLLDITVKSGIQAFAPHARDLAMYKQGRMGEHEYRERYLDKMFESMEDNRSTWDYLSVNPYKAIGCYCKAGEFCHRHIFKELAKTHLETMGWRPALMGEWTEATRDDQCLIIPRRHLPKADQLEAQLAGEPTA